MKKIIETFHPRGGKHCITHSLRQIFDYYGYSLTEEMMFGIASGLSFLYLNQSASPLINGRTKVFEFEKKLAKRLHIQINCHSGRNIQRIDKITKTMIDQDKPVLIYVDMPYLKYLGLDSNSHFGGHAVIVFGYDDYERKYYISDRDNHDHPVRVPYGLIANDYHLVDYSELQQARNSSYRPFPAHNQYLDFCFDGYQEINKDIINEAIRETCETMLYPSAQLLGINGIYKFSKEILKWRHFDVKKRQCASITNYFQISKDGGTGGGIFRHMYGNFLIEVSHLVNDQRFEVMGNEFIDVASIWDSIADDLWELSLNDNLDLLTCISLKIQKIYDKERELYAFLLDYVNKTLSQK